MHTHFVAELPILTW